MSPPSPNFPSDLRHWIWLVHYVKIITLLLLPNNVIDTVQSETKSNRKFTEENDDVGI